jgi:hypothetical protein
MINTIIIPMIEMYLSVFLCNLTAQVFQNRHDRYETKVDLNWGLRGVNDAGLNCSKNYKGQTATNYKGPARQNMQCKSISQAFSGRNWLRVGVAHKGLSCKPVLE